MSNVVSSLFVLLSVSFNISMVIVIYFINLKVYNSTNSEGRNF